MKRTVLANARVVDVENGIYHPDGIGVVIEDGRISSVSLPADGWGDAAVIDMGGRALVPGMFNTHCHLFMGPRGIVGARQVAKSLADCVDRGVTNIRDAMCYDLRDSRSWSGRVAGGAIAGPRINQAVHISIDGGTYAPARNPKTLVQLSAIGLRPMDYERPESGVMVMRAAATLQDFRDAVDRAIEQRGAQTIKLCDQPEHFLSYQPGAPLMSAAQLDAVADQSRRRGVPTTMHNVTAAGFRNGVRAGLTSLAHIPLDAVLDDADIDAFMAGRTMFEPTLSLTYFLCYNLRGSRLCGHPEIDRLDRFRDGTYERVIDESWVPELRKFRMGIHRMLATGNPKLLGMIDFGRPFNYYQPIITTGAENVRRLVDAGASARLACGTDAGASNCGPAAIDIEMAMLDFALNASRRKVFAPADFLRTATINSARSLGVDDRFGTISPGKVADIAVIDGDPLTDHSAIGRPVQALFMDGKMLVDRCGLMTPA